jgi:predicted nucleic acid-binding protein
MAERVVINTGPLIALAKMDALDATGQLPLEFICPAEVREELDEGAAQGYELIAPSWLTVVLLSTPLSPVSIAALDKGEAAVIQLAIEQGRLRVSIDEVQGRRMAAALGLSVVGSLGLVARAKALGIVQAIRPLIEKAMLEGIYYHPDLVSRVLTAAGE